MRRRRGNEAVATSGGGTTGTAMVSLSRPELGRLDTQLQEAERAIEHIEKQ